MWSTHRQTLPVEHAARTRHYFPLAQGQGTTTDNRRQGKNKRFFAMKGLSRFVPEELSNIPPDLQDQNKGMDRMQFKALDFLAVKIV